PPRGFAANPGLVWRWYMARFGGVREARPNAGHIALARLEAWMTRQTRIEEATEKNGAKVSGALPDEAVARRIEQVARHDDQVAGRDDIVAGSEHCGGKVRPGVVWFGEVLPADVVERAWDAVESCDVLLVVGTSGQVYPVANLPFIARESGAAVIDVNPDPSPISRIAHVFLQGPSGVILPAVLEVIQSLRE